MIDESESQRDALDIWLTMPEDEKFNLIVANWGNSHVIDDSIFNWCNAERLFNPWLKRMVNENR